MIMATKKKDGAHLAFVEDGVRIDDTFIKLLDGIERMGSIAAAALELGISYSFAHGSIRRAERIVGQDLVKESGCYAAAGSQLTELGKKMVADYRAIRVLFDEQGDSFIRTYMGGVKAGDKPAGSR